MDGSSDHLQKKLDGLLREAAEVEVELRARAGVYKRPLHYREIELAAHELGQKLSRNVQERAIREFVAESHDECSCPTCQARCKLTTEKRTIRSTDGPVEILEQTGRCDRCRRSFFPSA